MTPAEQNQLMRRILLQNSPKLLKKLPTVTGAFGGTTRVKLNNTGLLTRLFADIRIPYNASVAPTALTNKGVFAAVPRVQLFDFDGSTRVNTTAFHLQIRNAIRKAGLFAGGAAKISQAALVDSATGFSNDFRAPQVTLSGTGAQELRFVLEIPVAADVDSGDLRGMMPLQFVSGESQLAIDFASVLTGASDDDYVFSGGTLTTLVAPTVTVYQEYYLPQKVNGVMPIPMDDIGTVYELGIYARTTDNIAVGQEKLLNFPNVREVNGVYLNYINNKLLGGGSSANDITDFAIYANGATTLYQADNYVQNFMERQHLGHDLPQGVNAFDFAKGPISTSIYANVQLAVKPGGTLTGTPAVEVTFESFYPKGVALSGIPT